MSTDFWVAVYIVMFAIGAVTFVAFLLIVLYTMFGIGFLHHHHNISVSKCRGNNTGKQFTEGNVTGNPSATC